jgi:hypothetical protein
MVKKFRGKVKIADVQAEFDKLVDKINSLDTRINKVNTDKESIDWRYGGNTLAPINYTLTVGGLKQALNNFDGAVYGARAFKTDNTHFKMTDGLLISKYGGFRLPDSILTIPTSSRTLYYNVFQNRYQWTGSGEGEIEIPIDKTISNKTCLVPSQYIDNTFVFKTNYDDVPDANSQYNNFLNNSLDLTFLKTRNLESLSGNYLTYDPEFPNWVRLNISDYVYTAFKKLSIGDKITSQYRSDTYGANVIVLGTLTNDATYFQPKAYIQFWPNSSGGFKLVTRVQGINPSVNLTHRVIQDSASGTNGECAVLSTASVTREFDTPWDTGYGCEAVEFEFTQDENSDYILRVNLIDRDTHTIFGSNYAILGKNIEDFNINCCIFYNEAYNGYGYDYLNSDGTYEWRNAPPINKELNKVYKHATGETIYIGSDYNYTEWIKEQVTDGVYKICEISPQRDSLYLNDLRNVQVEDVYGTYEVAVQNRIVQPAAPWVESGVTIEPLNNQTSPKFISVVDMVTWDVDRDVYIRIYLGGKEIAFNGPYGHRRLNYWTPINFLYLPKGANSPFTSNYPNYLGRRMYNVITKKNIKG